MTFVLGFPCQISRNPIFQLALQHCLCCESRELVADLKPLIDSALLTAKILQEKLLL